LDRNGPYSAAKEFENEWQTNKIRGRSQNGESDSFSNLAYTLARGYEIRERQQPKVRPVNCD